MYISDAFNHHVIDYQECVIDYQECVIDYTVSDAQARISRSSEASRTDTIILKIKIWGVTEETKTYVIEVGDGHHIHCQGKCGQLKLLMQQLEVIQDFYLFALKGVDVILGLEWLENLGFSPRLEGGLSILPDSRPSEKFVPGREPSSVKCEKVAKFSPKRAVLARARASEL
ncbi:hypothetical protein Lal_00008102 [Lupinus albus]|nr:hypothetical protein Lal_00008102 [Lupinus albus]